jgi:hypothetical protein
MPNHHTVDRNGHRIVLQYLLKLIGINAVLLWAGMATADVRHGTYFASIYLPDYAAVAIDSRVTVDGNFRDDMCKLFPLSEHVIFFSAGIFEGVNSEGTIILSPHATAREVFEQSTSHSMSDIADQWAHNFLEKLTVFYPSNREIVEHNQDGFIARGVFAGETGDAGVVAYQATINRSINSEAIDLNLTKKKIPEHYFFGLGHHEVVNPILHNGPDGWAKQIHDQILAETVGVTGRAEEAAIWVSTITQAVIDRSGDHNTGGQVASIILERGHNWRWFRRPDFCPKY